MASTVPIFDAPCLDQTVVGPNGGPDTLCVPELRDLLREAIDASSWRGKHEALAVVMHLPDRFYLSTMLSGVKPIGARHVRALPVEIGCLFAKFQAEAFGLIVVVPVSGEDAVKQFVGGLYGVLLQTRRRP